MTEKMKPSGIAWIGDIPASWKTKKIKHYTKIVNGSTPDSSDFNCWDGPIKWITPADMDNTGIISEGERTLTQYGYNSCGTTLLPKGSVVISSRAPIGKINITGDGLCTNQGCKSLVSETDNRYLYYLLLAGQEELVRLGRGTTFIELSTYDLANFGIVLPQETEQCAIADFLDAQCAKIDSVITDIEKQIETLQKYKKSLITEVVTKGLDRSGPMKDSEIDWIGDIAKNYCVRRLKYLTVIKDGTHDTPDYVDESEDSYPLITSKYINYETKDINFEEAKHISKSDFEKIYKRSDVEYGDIIMPMIGTIGNPVIVQTHRKFAIKNVALFKTSVDLITAKYIFYQFYSDILSEQFSIMSRGGVQSFVSLEVLGNLLFIDCTHEEKQQIVEYLDAKCSHIDEVINQKKQQLSVILHHKKSLIYEYVTGKKRVTEVN